MELVYYPDPRLREVSKKISTIDQELVDSIPQMFEIMYKARGIGLGLAVSRALASNNDGQLTVVSAPGQGATFVLSLPIAPSGVAT